MYVCRHDVGLLTADNHMSIVREISGASSDRDASDVCLYTYITTIIARTIRYS